MSTSPAWHDDNAAYLSAALAWLRLKLERLVPAGESPPPQATAAGTSEPAPPRRGLFRARPPSESRAAPASESPRLPPPSPATLLEAAASALAAASAVEPAPALLLLAERLELCAFERDLLLLCVAMELDTRIAALCARAHDDALRPYPTFGLGLALFDQPVWEALSPERPLRRLRLIDVHQSGTWPLTASPLRADERIVAYVKGLNQLDERLASLLVPLAAGTSLELSLSQGAAADALCDQLRAGERDDALPIVRLVGGDAIARRQLAAQVSARFGLELLRVAGETLTGPGAQLESLARVFQRETRLLPIALYCDAQGVDKGGDGAAPSELARFLQRGLGLVFVEASDALSALLSPVSIVEVAKPTAAEQAEGWRAALGARAPGMAGCLAGQFDLNLGEIRDLAASASAGPPEQLEARLWQACRARARPALDALAHKLEPRAGWDDLVLPATELALLRQIAAQVGTRWRVYEEWGFRARMNRGLGISALFAGESGTGKTMAAEVLARALDLDLYRIDLSSVVSKYIGETEKNLRRVFDAAEQGGAILFFDEADALFGKRSEVKDSHDRYANIEINYLLQRIEAFSGLAILATNMKSAIDGAFVRRLRFIVSFAHPGPSERKQIWQRAFPDGVPRERLDYDRLARLTLTGGSIHSVALNAAFLAAGAGSAVSMPVVLAAAREELRKLARPVNEAELRWDEPAEVRA